MYLAIPSQRSCARAWVAAASAICDQGEAYNVVIDVDDPAIHDAHDHSVITLVDKFLRIHDKMPMSSVVNTIFPQALYEEHGAPKFYDQYLKVYDKLTSSKRWGRYFERMIRHKTLDGETYNPLAAIVERLSERQTGQKYTSVYELAVYDPLLDGRRLRDRQCLSFVSFKLHPERGICATALYRNHHYITRCLGNLIGLGRLQAFIAKEAGFAVGPLTCISTHAELDREGWGLKDARELVVAAASATTSKSRSLTSALADR